MRVLLLLPVLMAVAVKAAPPSAQPALAVLPGVEIIDTGSPVPTGSGSSSHQQVRPQIQPPRPIDRHPNSKPGPAILPAIGAQPIPDDALPELIRDDRAAQAQSDNVQGRFLPGIVVAIGNPSGNNYNNYEKPGSCYRPGWGNSNYYGGNGGNNYYGRRKRQVTYSGRPLPAAPKGGFGGQHGGNGGGFGNGGSGGWSDRCNRDRDCPGNKKCCSYRCQTPAVIG